MPFRIVKMIFQFKKYLHLLEKCKRKVIQVMKKLFLYVCFLSYQAHKHTHIVHSKSISKNITNTRINHSKIILKVSNAGLTKRTFKERDLYTYWVCILLIYSISIEVIYSALHTQEFICISLKSRICLDF